MFFKFYKLFPNFAVVIQHYETDVGKEYVIMGNDAILKCNIPSFVAEFAQVVSWDDSEGNTFSKSNALLNGISLSSLLFILIRAIYYSQKMIMVQN